MVIFAAWGIKYGLPFDKGVSISLIIMYSLILLVYLNTYSMSINEKYIKVEGFLRETTYITLDNVYKIGIENHPYQIAKNYLLYVYTYEKVYELPAHLFNKKELNAYLSKLCQEKGIEYYFNK